MMAEPSNICRKKKHNNYDGVSHRMKNRSKFGKYISPGLCSNCFSVKNRECLIPKNKKENLHKYLTGVVENKKCKMIAINSMPDHIHIFIGLHPTISISEIIKNIKISSNKLINEQRWTKTKFQWQDGFGVFSYGKSQIDRVYKYILNQEEHHKKHTFQEEYLNFLRKYGVEFKSEFVFDLE